MTVGQAGRSLAAAGLLGGTIALSFFSGGYFDRARLWAGIGAWVLVAVLAVTTGRVAPRTGPGRALVGGLLLLGAWTALSIGWTPLRDVAQADAERLLLYLGAVLAALGAFRPRALARAVEPALAAGAAIVVLEGISDRLLPGVFALEHAVAAQHRLDQPLTYWNAMGLIAAMGFVLAARIGGDASRPSAMRRGAAALACPLAVGVYLSFSRGALLAVAVGLSVLLLAEPTRAQLRAALVTLGCGLACAIPAGALAHVRTLHPPLSARESEGGVLLVIIVVAMAVAAAAVVQRRRGAGGDRDPAVHRLARLAVAATIAATVAIYAIAGAQQHHALVTDNATTSAQRLGSLESNRGDFWGVALRSFARHPIKGVGSGGFATEWLRHRRFLYAARDAHSIYIETLGELGLVGALGLLAFLGGTVWAGRRGLRHDPRLAAGAAAIVAMWLVHAGLDWDWEMPAVTLPALLCAAMLAASPRAERAAAGRAAEQLRVTARPEATVA